MSGRSYIPCTKYVKIPGYLKVATALTLTNWFWIFLISTTIHQNMSGLFWIFLISTTCFIISALLFPIHQADGLQLPSHVASGLGPKCLEKPRKSFGVDEKLGIPWTMGLANEIWGCTVHVIDILIYICIHNYIYIDIIYIDNNIYKLWYKRYWPYNTAAFRNHPALF